MALVNQFGNIALDSSITKLDSNVQVVNDSVQTLISTVPDAGEREFIHVTMSVNQTGSTTVYTPATGKRIRIRWIYAVNDPTQATAPLIQIFLGNLEKFRVYALSKRQVVTGDIDAPLRVVLNEAGNVAVTVLLEEI